MPSALLRLTRADDLSHSTSTFDTIVRDDMFEVSRRFGATATINAAREDPVERVLALTDGRGADVVLEAAGSPATVKLMLSLVRKEGRTVNIGYLPDIGALDVPTIIMKTLTCYGVGGNGGRGRYERAVELVARGLIDIEPMITHRLPLAEAPRGFEIASSKAERAIKVVLTSEGGPVA